MKQVLHLVEIIRTYRFIADEIAATTGSRGTDMRKAVLGTANRYAIWHYTIARSLRLGLKSAIFTIAPVAFGVTAPAEAGQIQTVFVIAMENHNWTQPSTLTSPQQIMGNPAAPYINHLVTPGNPDAAQVSYASNYLNAGPGIHPSEPNYIWSEAGSNRGIFNDNDPFPNNVQTTPNSLSNYLQKTGQTWRSYQEDTDVNLTNNQPVPKSQYTVPLSSFSGTFTSGTNTYNGSNQYNYAAKHDPQVFFTSTNGGNNPTNTNPLAAKYAPLQQLQTDLTNNTVAQYNWITPDQYNDMHSNLTGGFTYHGVTYTGDQASVAQGDNFLSMIVPEIEASQAYKNNGAIILWWDESEGGDTSAYTIPEIIISPDAKGGAYTNNILYTHSSDLLTMQEIFNVGSCLLDACSATDLSDLFKPGSIPNEITTDVVPEPRSILLVTAGLFGLALMRRYVLSG
jgi:phosphatidylinositol-3-phosphatase